MADEVKQLTLEELHDIPTDPETEKKVAQAGQLEPGTYNSVPELDARVYVADDGRRNVRYNGRFQGTGPVAGKGGYAQFWLSPDDRFKDTGKPDLKTKLMSQAADVYRLVNGLDRKAQVDKAEVLRYVQKYSVAVRFMQGDENEIGVAISRAKEI